MRGGRDGFSLVEALVSLAILAGVASTALAIVSSGSERNSLATERLRATLAAETLLNRVGIDIPLQEQNLSGSLKDGASWSLVVRPHEEPGLPASEETGLFRVEARVTPRRRGTSAVRLVTLRLKGLRL